MISEPTLIAAVDRGIITADQAAALQALAGDAAREAAASADPDDEKLRFIAGFADIFITIGIALFLGSMVYLLMQRTTPTATFVSAALASWLLAEFFTRIRRASLPSIVLLVTFAGAVFLATAFTLGASTQRGPFSLDLTGSYVAMLAALATVVATGLHYARFRVPITIAASAAALFGALLGLCYTLSPTFTSSWLRWLILGCGLTAFALAMRFDMSDLARRTRRTDIAFWLHLLAAPLIVHPLVTGITGGERLGFDATTAWTILAVFLAFGAVAVLIDRRALLVSGLSYAGFALGTLLQASSFTADRIPITLLALGLFVLLLSAAWRPLRGALLSLLPGAFVRRLPHASGASTS